MTPTAICSSSGVQTNPGQSPATYLTSPQSYDGEGRVSSLTDPAGHATDYSYGALSGFMTQMTYPQGDNIQYQQYDPLGRPLQVTESGTGGVGSCTTTFAYDDPEGLLTQQVAGALPPAVMQYTNSGVALPARGRGRAAGL